MRYGHRVVDAMTLMCELHADQVRKGSGEAYISHTMAVAAITAQYGGDEDQFIAALLHDAVEDQGGRPTLERIREAFGDRVAGLVLGCTDADEQPKPPWRGRKEAHLRKIAHAPPDLRLILAADKIHNARTIIQGLREAGPAVWDRFKGGREGTLWYYDQMQQALGRDWEHSILLELADTIERLRSAAASS